MLIMFKVKNFMSFKDEAILDMRATSYVQHPSHLLHVNEKLCLLKTAALYGANASGKSNFISAFYFFERYIFSQFISSKEDYFEQSRQLKYELEPFALSTNNNNVSEFEIIFYINNKVLQFGFECSSEAVKNEWFYIDDKKVYERIGTELSFGSKYADLISSYNKVSAERLYLSVLEYFLDDDAKKIILADFIGFFQQEYNVFSEILFESTVKGVAGTVGFSPKLLRNKDFRKKVEDMLRSIDVGIKRLDIQTETVTNEHTGKKRKTKVIRTVHNVYDEDGNIVGEKTFELPQESSGTLRFFSFIQRIIEMTSNGGVFVVDELSARLHPLLTRMIVEMFNATSNKKAQLIFTTHDISLLNKDLFRRDEVFFVDKNEKGESKIYALSDLRVREDASFSKDYLQGKYGAIPILKLDSWNGGETGA